MRASAIEVGLFALSWLLFVAAQAYNSIRSTANGLTGFAGIAAWLRLQSVNLATRAFFCAVFYGYVMQFVAQKVAAAGLTLHAYSIAGIAGYASNALLYQAFGLLPFLRVEVQDLAPPSSQPTSKGPTP